MRYRTLSRVLIPLLLLTMAAPLAAQPTDTARYRVRFQAAWSAATHPQNIPPVPHFSGLIGGVHDATVAFWQSGAIASPGIERMAEEGQQSPLDSEVAAAIAAGSARQVIRGGGIGVSPGMASTTFTASRIHPLATVVSMIAPSPDWFVGVSGLNLFEGGAWVQQKVVTLNAWDAGTDNGTIYTSPNSDTRPQQAIRPLNSGPFSNGVPLGSFTFTRLDTPAPEPLMLRGGRFKVTAIWQDFNLTRANAHPTPLTDETGYFWFFDERNVEAVIKVVDGCAFNQRYWVFAGGLTNVEVELRVEDMTTGQVNVYTNPLGQPFQPIQDNNAFTGCP